MQTPTMYPTTVAQHEIDMTLRTSISTIIGLILNVAGEDASAKGFGLDVINQKSLTWVLSRFALEIEHLPTLGERVDITTWIGDYRRLISTRNFTLCSARGECIGGAVSQWCMLDMESRRAVDLSSLHQNYTEYVLRDVESTIAPPCKIASPSNYVAHIHRVAYSDIDFNGHLNSLRYIDLLLDMLPVSLIERRQPLRVDMQFHHECYLGDELTVCYEQVGDVALFEIVQNGKTSAMKCSIEWR